MTYHGYDYEIVETADGRCWFAENLRTSKLSNGVDISENWVIDANEGWDETVGLAPPAYFLHEGNYYYNGGVAVSSANCCPINWHVPFLNEWNSLKNAYSTSPIDILQLADNDADYGGWLYPVETIGNSGMNLKERVYIEYPSPNWYQGERTRHWTSTPYSIPTYLVFYQFEFDGQSPVGYQGDMQVRKGASILTSKTWMWMLLHLLLAASCLTAVGQVQGDLTMMVACNSRIYWDFLVLRQLWF